jgi:hypothetical protein
MWLPTSLVLMVARLNAILFASHFLTFLFNYGFDSFSNEDEILFVAVRLSILPNLEVIYAKKCLASCDANRGPGSADCRRLGR